MRVRERSEFFLAASTSTQLLELSSSGLPDLISLFAWSDCLKELVIFIVVVIVAGECLLMRFHVRIYVHVHARGLMPGLTFSNELISRDEVRVCVELFSSTID